MYLFVVVFFYFAIFFLVFRFFFCSVLFCFRSVFFLFVFCLPSFAYKIFMLRPKAKRLFALALVSGRDETRWDAAGQRHCTCRSPTPSHPCLLRNAFTWFDGLATFILRSCLIQINVPHTHTHTHTDVAGAV